MHAKAAPSVTESAIIVPRLLRENELCIEAALAFLVIARVVGQAPLLSQNGRAGNKRRVNRTDTNDVLQHETFRVIEQQDGSLF